MDSSSEWLHAGMCKYLFDEKAWEAGIAFRSMSRREVIAAALKFHVVRDQSGTFRPPYPDLVNVTATGRLFSPKRLTI
jgi:hypothetical protein